MELGFEGKAVSSQVGYWYELADLSSAVSERLRDGEGRQVRIREVSRLERLS